MVDCSKKYCNGCVSGWPQFALEYIKANGIADDDEYPYLGEEETCWYSSNMSVGFGFINATYSVPVRGLNLKFNSNSEFLS